METPRRIITRTAWRLAGRYWTSEEKRSAWGLLLSVILLNLGNVYVGVRINEWNRAFYNALQAFDAPELFRQVGIFAILVICAVVASVSALYLNQMLQIRWRRWLTLRHLSAWLADRAYYRLQLGSEADNPDQRIAEDLSQFTGYVLSLSVGLISSFVSLLSFLAILWGLSGTADIYLGPLGGVHIPGYLVWAALIYAGFGTWLAVSIGRPLVALNSARQKFEADFRFSLVHLREHAESVALYGGEPVELSLFDERFRAVFANFRQIMKQQIRLSAFTQSYAQVGLIFPVIVVSPRYFARQILLGGLFQAVNAFSYVQNALSFIINSYNDIATWEAVTQRLGEFEERLSGIQQSVGAPQSIVIRRRGISGVAVDHLDIDLPDGTPLLRGVTFQVERGASLLIEGPSGSGKTTLLRAIAGIWPFGHGKIRLGRGQIAFVPQRPYLPLGTLADAVLYPRDQKVSVPVELPQVLEEVGLYRLIVDLDKVDHWSERLSLGEQQGLAFARILLAKPALIFLDEASSALDDAAKTLLFGLLRSSSWRPTVVSIGHGSIMHKLHSASIGLAAFKPRQPVTAKR
ncbi:MAG: ABC transporter ATP-binding protein/permease [Verrucomicrobia bacterium]|nr:ABC transporter ATP-binding protein/permease [Verrucomicrobiota bacterium]